jgi:hypothetical protein
MPSKTTDGSDVPLVQPDLPVRRAIPERQLNNNRGRLDRGGPFHSKKNPPAAAGTRHMRATRVATLELKNLRGNTMADDDLQDLTNARKILVEMRHNWAKAIAAGYKRGETETALKGLIEVSAVDRRDRLRDRRARRS